MALQQPELFGSVIMEDEIYRRILRMKALERWENEGGRVSNDETPDRRDGAIEATTSAFIGAIHRDFGHRNNKELTSIGGKA